MTFEPGKVFTPKEIEDMGMERLSSFAGLEVYEKPEKALVYFETVPFTANLRFYLELPSR